jgi:hypothetical protein
MAMQTRQYTGLAAQGEWIEWTLMRQAKDGLETVAHERRAASPDDPDSGAAARPDLRGTLCLCLPVADTLLRIIELPSLDRQELSGMVELQIGKMSPFPVDELVVSFEVLDERAGAALVLIAAARRETLERLRAELGEPAHIDIDLLAWWQALREEDREPGRVYSVLLNSTRAELIASDDGVPVAARVLLERDELGWHEFLELLSEELNFSAVALESDWGEGRAERLRIYYDDSITAEELEQIDSMTEMPVTHKPLGDFPPLSELLVRRRVERAELCLDLLPADWRSADAERVLKRRILRSVAMLAVVWVAAVTAVIAYGAWERASLRKSERRAEELKGPAQRSLELQSRIEVLERYADRTHSVLECLREVSVLLPANLELQSFSFKKNAQVDLRGMSSGIGATEIYTYFQALEKSDKFTALNDQRVTTATSRGGSRASQFQASLNLPGGEEGR